MLLALKKLAWQRQPGRGHFGQVHVSSGDSPQQARSPEHIVAKKAQKHLSSYSNLDKLLLGLLGELDDHLEPIARRNRLRQVDRVQSGGAVLFL